MSLEDIIDGYERICIFEPGVLGYRFEVARNASAFGWVPVELIALCTIREKQRSGTMNGISYMQSSQAMTFFVFLYPSHESFHDR
jgi:hypothetical protein